MSNYSSDPTADAKSEDLPLSDDQVATEVAPPATAESHFDGSMMCHYVVFEEVPRNFEKENLAALLDVSVVFVLFCQHPFLNP